MLPTIIRDEIDCPGNRLLHLGGFFQIPLLQQIFQMVGCLGENVESGADC